MNILVDHGGEFDNDHFKDFCGNFNVNIKTTAAESPWSNGMVERHNGIIGQSVSKIVSDVQCDLDVALAWAVSAKNSLSNVYGQSPNQLVFGRNPNYPNVLSNYLPALEGRSISEIVASNLNAMHSARRNFIEMESKDKIRRALKHQVRPSSNIEYSNGDKVYYKRLAFKEWLGPAVVVIGQEVQQVIIKHGSTPIRVHPCKLKLKREADQSCETSPIVVINELHIEEHNGKIVNNVVSSSDESDSNDVQVESVSFNNRGNSNQPPRPQIPAPSRPKAKVTALKPKLNISYRQNGQDESFEIVRQTGKATGKYKSCWEVLRSNESCVELDFDKDVSVWKPIIESVDDPGESSSEVVHEVQK